MLARSIIARSRPALRAALSRHTHSTPTFRSTNPPASTRISSPTTRRHLSITNSNNNNSSSTPMAAPSDTQAASENATITPDSLSAVLRANLNATHVEVQDISGGCGSSFAAVIVSDDFKGKSALQRHRLVNGVLKEEIRAIHAWTPRCLTVEQWEKEKEK